MIRDGRLAALFVVAVMVCAGEAKAGQLKNTFTAPSFEASISGPDTCAAGTVPQASVMTIRRKWTGQSTGQDSLTNVTPGLALTMVAGVANGTYTVTVDARDLAGNWSCPASINQTVRGKPSRVQNLGEAMIHPDHLADLLAVRLEDETGS
jgi:hypothetical protein